ncbi:hypothetical protein [Bacillus salipaludis]|nr:hypothetical protein [Bacillus salipaludis]
MQSRRLFSTKLKFNKGIVGIIRGNGIGHNKKELGSLSKLFFLTI